MQLKIDRHAHVPIWQQLYQQIADRIRAGQLPAGTRLPPERLLAQQLGVHRSTVTQSYRELAAEGLVVSRVGSGTRVAPLAAGAPAGVGATGAPTGGAAGGVAGGAGAGLRPLDWQAYLAGLAPPEEPALLSEARAVRNRPGILCLARGELAPDLVPGAALAALVQEAAAAADAWGYGASSGYLPLREFIAARAAARGTHARPDQVVVTAGAQQGLALVMGALLEPGDLVAVESPSYFRCLTGLFAGAGARPLPVPLDGEGMRPDALEQLLARHRLRAIFTTPSHQSPTGATMSAARRRAILTLAARYQVPVIEDDIYGELSFSDPPAPLQAMDPGGLVVQVGSFSKTLAAGLRVGWVIAPAPLAERIAGLKTQLEPGSSLLFQRAVAEFCARGQMQEHLDRLRQALSRRRDALADCLLRHLPDCAWTLPVGGYHIWVSPPPGHSTLAWFRAAARLGVAVMPGEVYGAGRGAAGGIRVNFSYPPLAQMEEAVRRLARGLREVGREVGRERDGDPAGGALV